MTEWRIRTGNDDRTYLCAYGDKNCHWADYDPTTGIRVRRGTDWACVPTPDELAQWDAEAPTITARIASNPYPERIYIRWRKLPKGGRSRNHATKELEAGISCYAASYNPISSVIEYLEDGATAGAALTYLLTGAPCYLLTGREVGRGSDGEPLLADVQVLCQLRPCADGFRVICNSMAKKG